MQELKKEILIFYCVTQFSNQLELLIKKKKVKQKQKTKGLPLSIPSSFINFFYKKTHISMTV